MRFSRHGVATQVALRTGPILCIAAPAALIAWLVPWGSLPVGYDVFRSLLIARTWADHGFPATLPAAGTGLDAHFGDQQLGFDALLAAIGGARLDERMVPPLIWSLVALQVVVVLLASRALRRAVEPNWLLLLPALSQSWLFRATTLRAMLLAESFVVVLLALAALRARERRLPTWIIGLPAMAFAYCHGAVVLPIALWLAAAVGTRIERGRGGWPWRDGVWLLAGIVLAATLRPDFPANLRVWSDLNLGTPVAIARGELVVRPTELLPLAPGDLLATEWPFLLAVIVLTVLAWRQRAQARWSLLLPALMLVAAAIASRRMFEIATPVLLVALAATVRGRLPRPVWLAAVVVACCVHAPVAAVGAACNRIDGLVPVARWLRSRGDPGDLVYVTDWGVSSPLAWHTRGSGLRFTGMIDPVFAWSHDRDRWLAWQQIKLGRAATPFATVREFGARFVVFALGDGPAGAPVGTTANSLRRALAAAIAAGERIDAWVLDPGGANDPRNWVVLDLQPRVSSTAMVRDWR